MEAGGIIHARSTTPGVLVRRVHPLPIVGRDPQPVEPRVRCGRLVGRFGGVAGGRDIAACQRLGHRRLDPDPGLVQRRGRIQASVRAGAGGAAVQPRSVLSLRAAGAHRGRLRAVRERAGRPAPLRHRLDPAQARDSRSAGGDRGAADRRVPAPGRLSARPRGGAKHQGRGRGAGRCRRDRGGVRAGCDRGRDQPRGVGAFCEPCSATGSPGRRRPHPIW